MLRITPPVRLQIQVLKNLFANALERRAVSGTVLLILGQIVNDLDARQGG